MDKLTAYKVLGLQEGATEEQIKDAYRTLAQQYSDENYTETSPLRQQAEDKMAEINSAFDTLMSYIRTGGPAAEESEAGPAVSSNDNIGRYPAIRKLINSGQADEALAELAALPYGSTDAEWNFLMGSAYYYKGWLDQALHYFQEACRLEPGNREYEAALRGLTGAASGAMPGSPYTASDQNAAAINCACNTCTLMCCMDACCRGL